MWLHNWFTKQEQSVLLFICAMAILGLFVGMPTQSIAVAETDPLDSISVVRDSSTTPSLLDIRTAPQSAWEALPNIGPKKAKAIVDYRSSHPFHSWEDILGVKGIGPKTLENMKPYLLPLGETTSLAPAQRSETKLKTKTPLPRSHFDINQATMSDLTTIKGIGPVKAQAILDKREQLGKFTQWDQLLDVKGIGPKTLESIKTSATLGE